MKVIIVSIEELKKGNKRLCLRPLRANNRCIACKYYDCCESRRVDKVVHNKRKRILQKVSKAKEQLRKFEKEFLEL